MTREDRDHLRILSICHYVLAAFTALAGCFPVIYLVIGIVMVTEDFGPPQNGNPNVNGDPNPPPFGPEVFGWLMIVGAAAFMLFYWALTVGLILAGSFLTQRKRRTFCLVVAGASCLFGMLGIVLGVFTFIVLLRPSVRDAFEPRPAEPPDYDRYHSE